MQGLLKIHKAESNWKVLAKEMHLFTYFEKCDISLLQQDLVEFYFKPVLHKYLLR